MAGKMPGKLLALTVDGRKLRCQTNGTLTLGTSLTVDDICKPDDVSPGAADAEWETHVIDSRNWKISVDAASFLDDLRENGFDLIEQFISDSLAVEVEFLTTPGDHDFPEDVIFAGLGSMDTLTLNAPAKGNSTYSVAITGNGVPTFTRIPVTT